MNKTHAVHASYRFGRVHALNTEQYGFFWSGLIEIQAHVFIHSFANGLSSKVPFLTIYLLTSKIAKCQRRRRGNLLNGIHTQTNGKNLPRLHQPNQQAMNPTVCAPSFLGADQGGWGGRTP